MPPRTILEFIAAGLIYAVLTSLYRRREGIAYRLRNIVRAELAYLGVTFLLLYLKQPLAVALLGGVVCALIVERRTPSRRRYISKSERRKVIARFELSGGRFNRRTHEIDHVIPFSKGGSNTADNLRVISRRKNRAKGRKSPWWDLLGR